MFPCRRFEGQKWIESKWNAVNTYTRCAESGNLDLEHLISIRCETHRSDRRGSSGWARRWGWHSEGRDSRKCCSRPLGWPHSDNARTLTTRHKKTLRCSIGDIRHYRCWNENSLKHINYQTRRTVLKFVRVLKLDWKMVSRRRTKRNPSKWSRNSLDSSPVVKCSKGHINLPIAQNRTHFLVFIYIYKSFFCVFLVFEY